MAVSFVKEVAGNATKTAVTTLTAAVPVAGCAKGNVLVACCFTGGIQADATFTDARGNTWVKWVVGNFGVSGQVPSMYVFLTLVETALISGDLLTLTKDSGAAQALGFNVFEFAGVSALPAADRHAFTSEFYRQGDWGYRQQSGNWNAGSGSTTPGESGGIGLNLYPDGHGVVGCVALRGPTGDVFTEDTDTNGGKSWTSGTVRGTTGGSATTNFQIRTAHKEGLTGASQEYTPTLGTARAWWAAIVYLPPVSLAPAGPRTPLAHRLTRCVGQAWHRRPTGIFVPDLWTPEPATI